MHLASGGKKNACDREVMGKIALVVNPKTNGLNVTYRAKAELGMEY